MVRGRQLKLDSIWICFGGFFLTFCIIHLAFLHFEDMSTCKSDCEIGDIREKEHNMQGQCLCSTFLQQLLNEQKYFPNSQIDLVYVCNNIKLFLILGFYSQIWRLLPNMTIKNHLYSENNRFLDKLVSALRSAPIQTVSMFQDNAARQLVEQNTDLGSTHKWLVELEGGQLGIFKPKWQVFLMQAIWYYILQDCCNFTEFRHIKCYMF